MVIALSPVGVNSFEISISVCLSVCLLARLQNHVVILACSPMSISAIQYVWMVLHCACDGQALVPGMEWDMCM